MGSKRDPPRWSRLGVKLTLLLACLLASTLAAFSYVVIELWKQTASADAVSDTERFSDTIKRSIRHSMMRNEPEAVHEIVNAVGSQKDVEWVRIINKDGKITYSTRKEEIGSVVDKKAEACTSCHQNGRRVEAEGRSRVLTLGDGHRVLATIDPIYNSPSCSTATCHAHDESQQVLGVLDVAVSLQPTDEAIRERERRIGVWGAAAIGLVCLIVALFLQWYVGRPARRLLIGTQRVAERDFRHRIAITGRDEMALLAESFNHMTAELRDLTEGLEERVRTAQMQIIRAEKLASLGRLAAGVAHELNNPLTGVLTFAHLVANKLPSDSQERADLEVVISETNRCAKIIRDLLQFSRESQADRKPENVNLVVRQMLAILQPQAQFQNIEVRLRLDESLPPIVADSAQLKQVFMNILMNAAEAMGAGGVLTVETSKRDRAAVVAFADTGCGIPSEILGKIFDPFFTTKEPGKGTGLGLAVSLKLVENHGGTIEVDSTVGTGSTFRVILPLNE